MSVPSIGLLLICTFLFSVFVYMAVIYWRVPSLQSRGVLEAYENRWWNKRTVIYAFLALWALSIIFPVCYFLLDFVLTGGDPVNTLAEIIEASREDHRFMWSIWNVLAGVTAAAVCIRLALSRISAPSAVLNWCARNYGKALAIVGAVSIVLGWI